MVTFRGPWGSLLGVNGDGGHYEGPWRHHGVSLGFATEGI